MLIDILERQKGEKEKLDKTKKLLTYITEFNGKVTVTGLMKLSYLVDLVSLSKKNKKISEFKYRRYTHGPFDPKIYSHLKDLVARNILLEETEYTPLGLEYTVYKVNEKIDKDYTEIKEDKRIIDDVLENLKGYGVKTLKEISYKTEPMKKLGTTMGGKEHFNELIPLE